MSRNVVSLAIAVAVAVSFLFVGVGAVTAHDNGYNVGASGQCTDEDGNGGSGSVGVSPDEKPDQGDVNLVEPQEVRDVVAAVQAFAEGQNGDGDCNEDDSQAEYDYLEAHAGNGNSNYVHVCYSQDTMDDTPPVNAETGSPDEEADDACEP